MIRRFIISDSAYATKRRWTRRTPEEKPARRLPKQAILEIEKSRACLPQHLSQSLQREYSKLVGHFAYFNLRKETIFQDKSQVKSPQRNWRRLQKWSQQILWELLVVLTRFIMIRRWWPWEKLMMIIDQIETGWRRVFCPLAGRQAHEFPSPYPPDPGIIVV